MKRIDDKKIYLTATRKAVRFSPDPKKLPPLKAAESPLFKSRNHEHEIQQEEKKHSQEITNEEKKPSQTMTNKELRKIAGWQAPPAKAR
jgi:hypothetical protein